jgi:hypothetical protein
LVESILRLFSLEWIAQKVGVLPKMWGWTWLPSPHLRSLFCKGFHLRTYYARLNIRCQVLVEYFWNMQKGATLTIAL